MCGSVVKISSNRASRSASMLCSESISKRPSSPARRTSFPRVVLRFVQQAVIDARVVEDPGENPGALLQPLVEAREISDEPEVLHGLFAGVGDLEVQPACPPVPVRARAPKGVALRSQVLQSLLQAGVHGPGVDKTAAQLDDGGHVLDAHRADVNAVHARRTGPQGGSVDHLAGNLRPAGLGKRAGAFRPPLAVEQGDPAGGGVDPLAQVEDEVAGDNGAPVRPDRPRGSGHTACKRQGRGVPPGEVRDP